VLRQKIKQTARCNSSLILTFPTITRAHCTHCDVRHDRVVSRESQPWQRRESTVRQPCAQGSSPRATSSWELPYVDCSHPPLHVTCLSLAFGATVRGCLPHTVAFHCSFHCVWSWRTYVYAPIIALLLKVCSNDACLSSRCDFRFYILRLLFVCLFVRLFVCFASLGTCSLMNERVCTHSRACHIDTSNGINQALPLLEMVTLTLSRDDACTRHQVGPVLDAHARAGRNFRGIRYLGGRAEQIAFLSPAVNAALAEIDKRGLVLDCNGPETNPLDFDVSSEFVSLRPDICSAMSATIGALALAHSLTRPRAQVCVDHLQSRTYYNNVCT
jgi:hypothetical protein